MRSTLKNTLIMHALDNSLQKKLRSYIAIYRMTQNNNNCKHFAVIDLGSSALRADIYAWEPPDSREIILLNKIRYLPRLGKLINNSICQNRIDEVGELLKTLKITLSKYPNLHIFPFGTAVFREAGNATTALRVFSEALGHEFTVLNGEKEAGLILKGITVFEKMMPVPVVLLDIGGRSTEISFIDKEDSDSTTASCSVPLGALSVFEQYFEDKDSDLADVFNTVQSELSRVVHDSIGSHKTSCQSLLGSSGTLRALQYLYDLSTPLTHNTDETRNIPIQFLNSLLDSLKHTPKKDIASILHNETHRYDLIIGGMSLLKVYVDLFDIESIFMTPYSARHGALLNLMEKASPGINLPGLYISQSQLPSPGE